jgi:hypothetical protein
MNQERLQNLLLQLREATRSTLVPRSGCIPLPRLIEALPDDTLSAEEKVHLAGCAVCQRTAANVRIAQHFRADAGGNLYDAATGQALPPPEPLDKTACGHSGVRGLAPG